MFVSHITLPLEEVRSFNYWPYAWYVKQHELSYNASRKNATSRNCNYYIAVLVERI